MGAWSEPSRQRRLIWPDGMSSALNRPSVSDFYIGAHAAVAGYRLLTRDASRYRTYFPKLELIVPGG